MDLQVGTEFLVNFVSILDWDFESKTCDKDFQAMSTIFSLKNLNEKLGIEINPLFDENTRIINSLELVN